MPNEQVPQVRKLALIVVSIGLNLGLGWLVAAIKLPFYLDSVGTLLATALGGFWTGLATGLASVLIGSLYVPTLWAYAPTAVALVLYAHLTRRYGFLRRFVPTIFLGVGLGIVTAVVSAPITTFVWEGASLAGADVLTAFFAATGRNLLNAVLLGGLSTDPIDKLITSLVALAVIRRVPRELQAASRADG